MPFYRYLKLIALILLCACKKDIGKVNYGNYPAEIGLLMTTNCATSGCHNSKSYQAANGYNLESWASLFQGSNSGSPVIPYSSKFSSLCYFVNTYSELGIQNTPTMPLNKKPLSQDEVKLIKDWIDSGAPDVNGKIMWAESPHRKKLYAVNQGCDVVTVFDSDTQLPIRFIKVGNKLTENTPHHLRVSPDGNYWYVIFIATNVIQKYRCSDDSYVGEISLGNAGDWNTFVISKDSKRAYCVSYTQTGRVVAVNLENLKLLHSLPGFSYSHGITLNATEDTVYITSQYGNYITKMDTGFSYKRDISLQNGIAPSSDPNLLNPHYIILAQNKKDLLITCQNSNQIRVFNIPTNSVTAIVPTGLFPQEIVFSESMNQYFVSCTDDTIAFPNAHGVITRINSNNYQDKLNIACGFQPHGIAVDERKKILYVLSRNVSSNGPLPHHTSLCKGKNGFVSFIDLTSFSVLPKRYELSVDPYFVFAQP